MYFKAINDLAGVFKQFRSCFQVQKTGIRKNPYIYWSQIEDYINNVKA